MPVNNIGRPGVAGIGNVAATAGAQAAQTKFDAKALRDAAYDKHTPVKNGEGYKGKQDLQPSSLSSVKSSLASWGRWEASKMTAVPADNITMRVVSYEYHSGKPMEAWLDAVPEDKILELNVATCVSGHDNLPHAKFAKENVYVAEIRGPDGKTTRSKPFGPGVTKQEEYSSVSPALTIDVSKPGDYVVTCSPQGSFGAGGYIEARKLVIHITGNEPTVKV
jgi:hypothetical protein